MTIRTRVEQLISYLSGQIRCSQGGILLGRATGPGATQEIEIGAGLTLTDGVLTADGGAPTWEDIQDIPVTISYRYGAGGTISAGPIGIAEFSNTLTADLNNLLHYTTPQGGFIKFKAIFASVAGQNTYTFPDKSGTVAMLDDVAPGTTPPHNAVEGVGQVETLTVTAGASTTETLNFEIVTNGGAVSSNYDINVTAADNTPSLVAAKIRAEVALDGVMGALWQVGGSGANVTYTKKTPFEANDSALAMSLSRGVTILNTSTNTTSGEVTIAATASPPYFRIHGGKLYVQESGIWKQVTLSALPLEL